MTTVKKQIELRDKILLGLEITYEKLIEFKKQKNTEIVVMRDNKIVKINPHNT
jgi:sulfur carrier protein ThiS